MEKGKEVAKAEPRKTAIQSLANKLEVSVEVVTKTLKATAFKACSTNEDFVAAVVVANNYGLNPLLKEMAVFPAKGGGVIPIVMIDGWISLVNRQPNFDGVELIENEDNRDEQSPGGLRSVTAKFYIKTKSHPIIVTEYMKECYNDTKEPWKKWPRRMLRHKAYIQGARIAFGFSGIFDPDEADRIIEAETTSIPMEDIMPQALAAAKGQGEEKEEEKQPVEVKPEVKEEAKPEKEAPLNETTRATLNELLVKLYKNKDYGKDDAKFRLSKTYGLIEKPNVSDMVPDLSDEEIQAEIKYLEEEK